jgi:hypothetical protein
MRRDETFHFEMAVLATSMMCFTAIGCGSPAQSHSASGIIDDPAVVAPATLGAPGKGKLSDGASAGVSGTILYVKNYSPDHEIVFIELSPGVVAIAEELSMDSGQVSMLPAARAAVPSGSLVGIYRQLNPTSQDVPVPIQEAEQRQAVARAKMATAGLSVVAPTPEVRSSPLSTISQAENGTCSSDENGDNWSAQWFLNNFCTNAAHSVCPTNTSSYNTGQFEEPSWQYSQMEGDWNLPGTIQVSHATSCFPRDCWVIDAWRNVPARTIENWSCNGCGKVQIIGGSQCNHEDAAIRW